VQPLQEEVHTIVDTDEPNSHKQHHQEGGKSQGNQPNRDGFSLPWMDGPRDMLPGWNSMSREDESRNQQEGYTRKHEEGSNLDGFNRIYEPMDQPQSGASSTTENTQQDQVPDSKMIVLKRKYLQSDRLQDDYARLYYPSRILYSNEITANQLTGPYGPEDVVMLRNAPSYQGEK